MRQHLTLPPLTDKQLQIVNGSLLGDASLCKQRKCLNANWKFTKGQSIFDNIGCNKKIFMDWHFDNLYPYSSKLSLRSSNYKLINLKYKKILNVHTNEQQTHSYIFSTHAHPTWTDLAKKWYLWNDNNSVVLKNNRIIKIVPRDLILTSLTVCIWFMDDGSLDAKNGNAIFCTNGFTKDDCEFLVERLEKDVGIKSHVRYKAGYPVIFVGVKFHKHLINLIKQHVEWDCFKYKIDDTYDKIHNSGENHPLAKLSESAAKKMIEMRQSGKSVLEIANLFKVSDSNVSLITSGFRWKHLENNILVRKKPRLTKEIKDQIITLNQEGIFQKEIAKKLNVNQSTISRTLAKL
jgi:transposase